MRVVCSLFSGNFLSVLTVLFESFYQYTALNIVNSFYNVFVCHKCYLKNIVLKFSYIMNMSLRFYDTIIFDYFTNYSERTNAT